MKKFYVLRDSFYTLLQQYPEVLEQVSDRQRDAMVETMDVYDIMASAVSYFQSDIVMENGILYMKNSITQECCSMECKKDYLLLDHENNLFLPLLKRKYRNFLMKDFDLI